MKCSMVWTVLALPSLLCWSASPAVAADILVNDLGDSLTVQGGHCQLRDAISAANSNVMVGGCSAGSGADRILFDAVGVTITLVGDLPPSLGDLEIDGVGVPGLIIDGDDTYGILSFFTSSNGVVRNLTVRQGFAEFAGASCVEFEGPSGLVEDVSVEGCFSDTGASAVRVGNATSATIRRTRFEGNVGVSVSTIGVLVGEDLLFLGNTDGTAALAGGSASMTLRRSTFFDNEHTGTAGVVISSAAATGVLEHCTITQNRTNAGDEAGLRSSGSLHLLNTVIAGNTQLFDFGSPDIGFSSVVSGGSNFIGDNTDAEVDFPAGFPNASGDFVGTEANLIDPDLGPLNDNGGPTFTLMPGVASPLLDQGVCPTEVMDQRGFSNPATMMRAVDLQSVTNLNDGCDIGAVERGASDPVGWLFFDGFESGDLAEWSP